MNVLDLVEEYRKVYEGLSNGNIAPAFPQFGSCFVLSKLCRKFKSTFNLAKYISEEIAPTWASFSGNTLYPVPVQKGFCPEEVFQESNNLWIGDYGRFRKLYCGYVAYKLGKLTEEDILKWTRGQYPHNMSISATHQF